LTHGRSGQVSNRTRTYAPPESHRFTRDLAIFTISYWRGLRATEPGQLLLSGWDRSEARLFVHRGKGSESGADLLSPAEKRALKAGSALVLCLPRGKAAGRQSCTAWTYRSPAFKSRQPDQTPQRPTDEPPARNGGLESNWSPKPLSCMGSIGTVCDRRARDRHRRSEMLKERTMQGQQLLPRGIDRAGRLPRFRLRSVTSFRPSGWRRTRGIIR
jgi:hypothetical protein